MNQPELGKKITGLRKAKGLTQEELTTMCNLNVRTLQRIESGEVMPRSYTIKLIFAALDYNIYDSIDVMPDCLSDSTKAPNWLGQIYRYVFDLFNLKTNTMKKLLILSAVTIGMVFLFAGFSKVKASTFDKSEIAGTWQLCDSVGMAREAGSVRFKIISTSTFVVLEVDKDKHFCATDFIGTCSMENGIYTETIEYTTPALCGFKKVKNSFKIEFKDDFMYVKGIGNSYNEIWKRTEM